MAATRTADPAVATVPHPRTHPGDSPRAGRWTRQWPLLPLIATVLLLTLPVTDAGTGDPQVTRPADLVSGLAVLLCLARLLHLRRRPLTPAAALVLGLPALGFAVATVTAADPSAALPGFVRYLQVFVLVPAAVCLLIRDAQGFRTVVCALVLLALVQGVTGIHQYATGTGASYMGEDIRAVGTFGPGDIMGMATVVAFGLLATAACVLRTPEGAPRWLRPCALGATTVLLVALVLSFSRGSWIATAIAALALITLTGPRQALRALAVLGATAVVLIGGFGIGSEMVSQRLTSITEVTADPDQSVTDRYTMWSAAASMWREHPAAGVGLKGFPAHRDGHASIALSAGSDTAGAGQDFRKQPLLSPHNMYLLVLSEQGLIGLTALAGSWLALLAGGVRRVVVSRARGDTAVDCGLVAVGLMVWQTVDFLYADIGGPSTVLTGIVLGLAAWWALAAPEKVRPT
ncbi:O-antigen ligase family protein [Streptomyces sp. NPDC048560]|uniref:O-antigen ligase family protein n=1 Tax=Streptomyces sp. NPDC048560 TaxID=3155488 RepID=UPI003444CCAD